MCLLHNARCCGYKLQLVFVRLSCSEGESIVDIPGILDPFPCSSHGGTCCSLDTLSWLRCCGGGGGIQKHRFETRPLFYFCVFFFSIHTQSTAQLNTGHVWCVPRSSGKSPASSCWPSSSALSFWAWLLVIFSLSLSVVVDLSFSLTGLFHVSFVSSTWQILNVGSCQLLPLKLISLCTHKVTWKASPV